MKVSLFEQVPYRYMPEGFENQHNSVVTAPYQVVEPARMTESLFSAYAELMHGARAGFDGICVTEHSQSSYDISPNPTLLASAVACAARAEQLDVAITVLGRSLGKTREPLKIAEEYALLDCVSGGRLDRRLPGRAQLRREPERVPARGRDPRALPRAPRADPEGVVRAAALPVERPLREVRSGEHLAAAGPAAASADLDPGHRLARDAAGHPLPGLRSSCT